MTIMRPASRLFAGLLLAVLVISTAEAASTKVTFVLVSDNYQMSGEKLPGGRMRGGFASLATLVKAERAKGPNVIVAHAGDTLSPSLMSGFDRGAHIMTLTNLIQPDIFVPGNHEFDFGKAVFLERMREAKFPLFAANLRGADGQPVPGFKDRTIRVFDGVKIGLTGATYDETPRVSSAEDLKFNPTIDTIKEQAAALRRDGADFVVAVVHSGRGQDYALGATGAAEMILTGHDHDLFINYDERGLIVESSYDARRIVVVEVAIDVTVRDGRKTVSWTPQFRVVDTGLLDPDPEVAAVVAKLEQDFSREMDVPLATTEVELDSRNATVRAREAAIGNLLADAIRASAKAEIGLTNGGSIRAGRIYPPGTRLTRRNVMEELPFSNRVVTVEIVGKELRRGIEIGLRALPNPSGAFLQVSGITIEADVSKPAGQRVVSIKVGDAPLDENRVYRVATTDFVARGGDGYVMFRDAKQLLPPDDAPLIATELMTYLKQIGTVRSKVEGRIVFK